MIAVDYISDFNELNGNLRVSPGPWTTDTGGGLIAFVGSSRHSFMGTGAVFPDIVEDCAANCYAAGTFLFAAAGPPPPPPGPCVPPLGGLAAWWPFGGSLTEILSRSNAIPLGTAQFAPGEVGPALFLDGSGGVSAGQTAGLNIAAGGAFTVEGWINPARVDSYQTIIEWGDRRGRVGLHLAISQVQPSGGGGPGSLWANLIDMNDTAHSLATAGGLVASNTWSHIALTYDPSSGVAQLYVNGVSLAQNNFGQISVQTGFELFLGERLVGSTVMYPWVGGLDEITLYTRPLSGTEVRSIFNAGAAGKCKTAPVRPTYDLALDFSLTGNPNGPWSYGWQSNLSGAFSLLSVPEMPPALNGVLLWSWQLGPAQYPAVEYNPSTNTATSDGGSGVFPPGTVFFFPGQEGTPQNFGVIRFTVRGGQAGTYQLSAVVQPYLNSGSGDTDFHILKNGTELFGQFLSGTSPPTGYTNQLTLTAGDVISFAVGRGADGRLYASGLKIKASLDLLVGSPPNQPPTAKATIGPLANLPSKIPNPQIISANGINATVVLDGSLSSDPENDPLQFSWATNGVAFASGMVATTVLPVGTYTVTLTVSEAGANASDSLTVDIITSGQATEELGLLVDDSSLSRTAKRPLMASLQTCAASLQQGDLNAALGQLGAFQNKVRALVGHTDPGLAQALIDAAQAVLNANGGP